jgi:flagellar biosynthesis protein FlhG
VRLPAHADILLVLATEEPTSLTDAYAVLKLHAADAATADARVVINLAGGRAAGERTFAALDRACMRFLGRAPALAGVIRRDDRVRDAIRRQAPLLTCYPASMAALDVQSIAAGLLSGRTQDSKRMRPAGTALGHAPPGAHLAR